MSAVEQEARRLQAAEPPAQPDLDVHVVRMLRVGRGVEIPVNRDFEHGEEVSGSFKDSDNHQLGSKQTLRVAEINERLYQQPGHPPWIKRLYVLKLASS